MKSMHHRSKLRLSVVIGFGVLLLTSSCRERINGRAASELTAVEDRAATLNGGQPSVAPDIHLSANDINGDGVSNQGSIVNSPIKEWWSVPYPGTILTRGLGGLTGFTHNSESGWQGSGTGGDPYYLKFTGSNSRQNAVNVSGIYQPQAYSIWFRTPEGQIDQQCLMEIGNQYGSVLQNSSTISMSFYPYANNRTVSIPYQRGKWNHVVASRYNGTTNFYFNCRLIHSENLSIFDGHNIYPTSLGKCLNAQRWMLGDLHEFRHYRAGISPAEVARVYLNSPLHDVSESCAELPSEPAATATSTPLVTSPTVISTSTPGGPSPRTTSTSLATLTPSPTPDDDDNGDNGDDCTGADSGNCLSHLSLRLRRHDESIDGKVSIKIVDSYGATIYSASSCILFAQQEACQPIKVNGQGPFLVTLSVSNVNGRNVAIHNCRTPLGELQTYSSASNGSCTMRVFGGLQEVFVRLGDSEPVGTTAATSQTLTLRREAGSPTGQLNVVIKNYKGSVVFSGLSCILSLAVPECSVAYGAAPIAYTGRGPFKVTVSAAVNAFPSLRVAGCSALNGRLDAASNGVCTLKIGSGNHKLAVQLTSHARPLTCGNSSLPPPPPPPSPTRTAVAAETYTPVAVATLTPVVLSTAAATKIPTAMATASPGCSLPSVQYLDNGPDANYVVTAHTTAVGLPPINIGGIPRPGYLNDYDILADCTLSGKGASALFRFEVCPGARYRVSLTWVPISTNARSVPVQVSSSRFDSLASLNLKTVSFDMRATPNSFADGGVNWQTMLTSYQLGSDDKYLFLKIPNLCGADTSVGQVIADAVKIEKVP